MQGRVKMTHRKLFLPWGCHPNSKQEALSSKIKSNQIHPSSTVHIKAQPLAGSIENYPWPPTSSCGNIFQENALPETTVSHATNHKQRGNKQLWDLTAVIQEAHSIPRPCPFSGTPQDLTLPMFIYPLTSSPGWQSSERARVRQALRGSLQSSKAILNLTTGKRLSSPDSSSSESPRHHQIYTYRKKQSFLPNKEVYGHWGQNNLQGLGKSSVGEIRGLSLILTIHIKKEKKERKPGVEMYPGNPQTGRWRHVTSSPA